MALRTFTLRTRIYLSMLAIILVSFVVTGTVSIYDHYEQNEGYNEQRLARKEEAVQKSMEHFIHEHGGYINQDSVRVAFSDKVCELAEVHNLFIALFDLNGQYLISNSSEAMDSLGVPNQVSYSIRKQLITGNPRAVDNAAGPPIIDSTFSRKNYFLAYWYFNDIEGKPVCITNVVYEKSDSEKKDLMAFLSELGQSYILLFLFAAVVAYFLSRYITRSLEAIGQRLHRVRIGHHNDPIEWPADDEIGKLVKEYNRMLAELEVSARRLAQTERESAWREMAQQVAHEIKNPLTPMKLRVQHLERAWRDDPTDFNERLAAFTRSMTEQIDTLSNIASEFSHFAKMPRPVLAPLDLALVARDTTGMFEDAAGHPIRFRAYGAGGFVVHADHDQVIRMMNNLLSNALQSTPDGRQASIDVAVRAGKKSVIIRVNDRGAGISKEQRSRIFEPNFTTKSTGTGLGLAMVRNMMTQYKGKTWFHSRPNRGASFFLQFMRPEE